MKYSNNNLSHALKKHGFTEDMIKDIESNPDFITVMGNLVRYFYKDDNVVIFTRFTKKSDWYFKTAYKKTTPFMLGDIIYDRESRAK